VRSTASSALRADACSVPGRPGPQIGCRTRAGPYPICRPPRDPSFRPCWPRDLARACPPREPPRAHPAATTPFLPGGITMNATAIPVDELIGQLLAAAGGILAGTAAAGLDHQPPELPAPRRLPPHHQHRRQHQHRPAARHDRLGRGPARPARRADALRILRAGDLADRRQPRRSRHRRPAAHRSRATRTAATSPWSLTPSPPPTANPSQLPGRPGPQIGCRTPCWP